MVPGRMVPVLGSRIPPTLVVAGILPSSFGPTHQPALLCIDALLDNLYTHGVLPPQKEHIISSGVVTCCDTYPPCNGR